MYSIVCSCLRSQYRALRRDDRKLSSGWNPFYALNHRELNAASERDLREDNTETPAGLGSCREFSEPDTRYFHLNFDEF